MIMNKKIFMVSLLAAVLFISACTSDTGDTSLNKPFIGGIVGVNMKFMEGQPPDAIFDNGKFPFTVGIQLENFGEDDLMPVSESDWAELCLIGINPSFFGIESEDLCTTLSSDLRGARKNFDGTILPGDAIFEVFGDDPPLNYEPDLQGNTDITMRAELCYDYTTKSTSEVCIKDDVLGNINDDTICILNEQKDPQNSGGPVHVSSLRENALGQNKIQVSFVIAHVGGGEIFDIDTDHEPKCDDDITNIDRNKVFVEVSLQSESDATITSCSGLSDITSGTVTLYQGSPAQITCVIEGNVDEDKIYTDIFEVDMSYKYGQYIEKNILIQDVSSGDE